MARPSSSTACSATCRSMTAPAAPIRTPPIRSTTPCRSNGRSASRRATFLAHYTWSKMIDDASVTDGNLTWLGGSTSFQDPLNYALERSLSQHDVPHRFVASGDWQLPVGRGRHFLT